MGDSTKARKHLGWKPQVDFPVRIFFGLETGSDNNITNNIFVLFQKDFSKGYDGF